MELLELQAEQEKKELKADAVQAKEELRWYVYLCFPINRCLLQIELKDVMWLSRLQEHCAEQLSSLKVEHLQVLDKLRATHALEYSSSKVAEQANTINTQEVQGH